MNDAMHDTPADTPPPPLFDERLAMRVDTLLTATAALALVLIQVVNLVSGSRIEALFTLELLASTCLPWSLARRFHRIPIVAVVLVLATLASTLGLAWYSSKLPAFLVPTLHGLVTCAFIVSARLPRPAVVALVAVALGLTVVRLVDLGVLGPMAVHGLRSDLYPVAAAGVPTLWLLVALSARPATRPPPPSNAPPRWAARPQAWWRTYRIALVASLVMSVVWATVRWLDVPFGSVGFNIASVLTGWAGLLFVVAFLGPLRLVEGRSGTSFWGGQDLFLKTLIALLVLVMAVQIYDLATNGGRWQDYILGVGSMFFVTSSHLATTLALLFLLHPAGRHPTLGQDPLGRARRRWGYLVLADLLLGVVFYSLRDLFDLSRNGATVWALAVVSAIFGAVAAWGLLRTLHRDIEEATLSDTFSR
jgi:hypothetical protein